MSTRPIFRFAPSPNGELHLGHAYSALVSFDMARRLGGRFLLRIEDIDVGRCRPEFEARILEDLAWLGLEWEEPVRRQSEHFETYRDAAARLEDRGLLYPCFATRKEIAEAVSAGSVHLTDPDGAPLYPGLYRGAPRAEIQRRRAAVEAHALRLDLERAVAAARKRAGADIAFTELATDGQRETVHTAEPGRWGDTVIVRKDVPTSYHLSVVVDDALQGVTHVTRGRDLFAATDLHRLLQILLDLPEPLYHHHDLIADAEGRKLSKSHEDRSLRSLRDHGATPADIRRMVGLRALGER